MCTQLLSFCPRGQIWSSSLSTFRCCLVSLRSVKVCGYKNLLEATLHGHWIDVCVLIIISPFMENKSTATETSPMILSSFFIHPTLPPLAPRQLVSDLGDGNAIPGKPAKIPAPSRAIHECESLVSCTGKLV